MTWQALTLAAHLPALEKQQQRHYQERRVAEAQQYNTM